MPRLYLPALPLCWMKPCRISPASDRCTVAGENPSCSASSRTPHARPPFSPRLFTSQQSRSRVLATASRFSGPRFDLVRFIASSCSVQRNECFLSARISSEPRRLSRGKTEKNVIRQSRQEQAQSGRDQKPLSGAHDTDGRLSA